MIKGNRIEIDGNVTILKNDKHANIMEQDDEGTKISIVNIDNENLRVSKEGTLFLQPEQISYGRFLQLEDKLSIAIMEIDKLKTAIKSERVLTHNLINDAIIKATIANGK